MRMCEISYVYWNNEELSGLVGHDIRRTIGAWDVEREREKGNAYRVLVAQTAGKRPLPSPWSKWENSVKTYLAEI